MREKSSLESILKEKCPRCRKGDMFISPKYHLRNFDKMYSVCKVCGLKYDIEPGFYTGAMFVSYAFSVAITIVVGFFLFIVFDDPDIYIFVTAILATIILLFPVLFRYSRVIYLHIFGGIHYNSGYEKQSKK